MPKSPANTSWGGVADWYDDYLEKNTDSYQRQVILPNLLRLLEVKSGEKVLDLACGSGFFSRELAKVGADVTGMDISPELIKLARNKSENKKINYVVSRADQLNFPAQSFAKIICVLALQNMREVKAVFESVATVLRRGGQFLIVLNHPAFRIPGASAWGWDEVSRVQYRRLDSYMSEKPTEIVMHPGVAPRQKTLSFHRPLQDYFKSLDKAGFVVKRLEEWVSHKASESGPRQSAENRARHEFPLFLCLEAIKL